MDLPFIPWNTLNSRKSCRIPWIPWINTWDRTCSAPPITFLSVCVGAAVAGPTNATAPKRGAGWAKNCSFYMILPGGCPENGRCCQNPSKSKILSTIKHKGFLHFFPIIHSKWWLNRPSVAIRRPVLKTCQPCRGVEKKPQESVESPRGKRKSEEKK